MISADQQAEHDAEERVDGDLVREHSAVAKQRRPGAAPPVWVKTVDDDHAGDPESEVLDLGRRDCSRYPPSAESCEHGAEQSAVQEM
jgi:hypothetical protein